MRIETNKDIEESYESEVVKGFTMRETIYIVCALSIMIGGTIFIWKNTGLSPDICVYASLPLAIPVLIFGFKRVQGLTLWEYIREMIYAKRTRRLLYDADEISQNRSVFTMERRALGRAGKNRGKGRKK